MTRTITIIINRMLPPTVPPIIAGRGVLPSVIVAVGTVILTSCL